VFSFKDGRYLKLNPTRLLPHAGFGGQAKSNQNYDMELNWGVAAATPYRSNRIRLNPAKIVTRDERIKPGQSKK